MSSPVHVGSWKSPALTDLYLKDGSLRAKVMGRGFAWLDTGTMDSLMDAANFVQHHRKTSEHQNCRVGGNRLQPRMD